MSNNFSYKRAIALSEKLSSPIYFLDSRKQAYIDKQTKKLLGDTFEYKDLFIFIEKLKRKYFLNNLEIKSEKDISDINKSFNTFINEIIDYLKLDIQFKNLYSIESFPGYKGIRNIINNGSSSIEISKEKRKLSNKDDFFIDEKNIFIPIYKTSLHKSLQGWIKFSQNNENIDDLKIFTILNIIFSNLSSEICAVFELNKSNLIKNAIIDELTGAYKREYFLEMLKSDVLSLDKNEKIILLFLDIDHFKNINDKYGHNIGDIVLKEFGREIKKTIRNIDYVGRFGGEEFLVAIKFNSECNEYNCTTCNRYDEIIKRINRELKIRIGNNPELRKYNIRFSGGVSSSGEINNFEEIHPDKLTDTLIKIADDRLYTAKNSGRNKIYTIGGKFILSS